MGRTTSPISKPSLFQTLVGVDKIAFTSKYKVITKIKKIWANLLVHHFGDNDILFKIIIWTKHRLSGKNQPFVLHLASSRGSGRLFVMDGMRRFDLMKLTGNCLHCTQPSSTGERSAELNFNYLLKIDQQ